MYIYLYSITIKNINMAYKSKNFEAILLLNHEVLNISEIDEYKITEKNFKKIENTTLYMMSIK